jgi:hypothetical protein
VIDTANAEITVCELAERLSGQGVRRGGETFFLCPLHDDHDPSLRVDAGKNLWYCDPCAVGGDAVRLARLAWDHDRDDVAAAELLLEFGHELPKRPPSWFARHKRQAPIRDAIGRARFEHLRRRLFRTYFRPLVTTIEDEEDRRHDEQVLWEATDYLARLVLSGMMGGDRDGR